MTTNLYVIAGAVVVLAAGGAAFTAHERAIGARDAEIAHLTTTVDSLRARKASVMTRYVHDTVEVARWRTAYQTIRDTINVHDTVQVRAALADADTTIRACTVALSRCDSIQAVNDTLTTALQRAVHLEAKSKPGFWDRVGLFVGYGGVVSGRSTTSSGVVIGAGIRVWP